MKSTELSVRLYDALAKCVHGNWLQVQTSVPTYDGRIVVSARPGEASTFYFFPSVNI